jgi:hypothetical protein
MEGISASPWVLIDKDIQMTPTPQKKLTARHFPETSWSKYSPSDRH